MDRYERLEATLKRFEEIEAELAHPGEYDQARVTALAKERAALEETVETYRRFKAAREAIEANNALLRETDDSELRALAHEEDRALHERQRGIEQQLQALLVPKDPNDERNVFIEIRAGAGGDEASIFAADLARMYMRYAESQRMKVETISMSESESAGYKEIVFAVKGKAPYKDFKHESGVHRVQRVPVTEGAGRVHTSTATVAVLPLIEEDTAEIEINAKDLEIDTFKASGAGGQHV
ncbi:MAG: PCRF domain-containing protein, partial [Candidatus Eremiobacteraeota bacterium]|nr:PCRF domain-containing protein [Candidatus Eremiobacteraeota bacterium]